MVEIRYAIQVHTYINVHLYALEREVRNTEGVGGRMVGPPYTQTFKVDDR